MEYQDYLPDASKIPWDPLTQPRTLLMTLWSAFSRRSWRFSPTPYCIWVEMRLTRIVGKEAPLFSCNCTLANERSLLERRPSNCLQALGKCKFFSAHNWTKVLLCFGRQNNTQVLDFMHGLNITDAKLLEAFYLCKIFHIVESYRPSPKNYAGKLKWQFYGKIRHKNPIIFSSVARSVSKRTRPAF